MKKARLSLLLWIFAAPVFAWTIGPMNYQGRLLDAAGIPVTGTYNFKIRIYDAVSGGALRFSEQHDSVAVDDGVYSILVSTGTTLSGTWDIGLWNTPSLYMEVEVNGQTLAPRHVLAATPFAFQANLALTTNNALALGGKTAAEYDSSLANICVSSKGKWLELVGKCLGVGASFPGPTIVNLNTLTASTDLSELELSKADVTGINFGSANFTGTVFRGTRFKATGIATANMTNTVWDAVVITGSGSFAINFTGALISNSDMTGWNLSVANLTNSSIADLTVCPSGLPPGYVCRDEGYNTGKYIVLGPNMNFSETSLMKDRLDSNNLSQLIFDNTNISGVSFKGNKMEQLTIGSANVGGGANVSGDNFTRTTIRNTRITFGDLSGAMFDQSSIHNMIFDRFKSAAGLQFQSSELDGVGFSADVGTQIVNFGSVITNDIQFNTQVGGGNAGSGNFALDFENSSIANTRISAPVTALVIFNTTVSGGIYLGDQVSNISMENAHFINGNISGNWKNMVDNSSDYINVSFFGADLTGASGLYPGEFISVNWTGATCPDGHFVSVSTDTCIGHGI